MRSPNSKSPSWKYSAVLPLLGACALLNCSGQAGVTETGDADSAGAGGSGVEGDRLVRDLTRPDAEAICNVATEKLEESVMFGMCVRAAAEQSATLSNCEFLSGACEVEFDVVTELCVEDLLGVDCDATVDLLERCAEDTYRPFEVLAEGGCEAYFKQPPLGEDELPQSCAELAEKCPELYGGDVEAESTSPAIVGEVDGDLVAVGAGEAGLGSSAANGDVGWTSKARYVAASLYLWDDGDGARGLVELPHAGQRAVQWICLAEVETNAAENESGLPHVWNSSNLSRLKTCSLNGAEPLDLNFELGGSVEGTFHGEALDWINSGHASVAGRTEVYFEAPDGAQVTLSLDLAGAELGDADELPVRSAVLIETGGEGAAACGGNGMLSGNADTLTLTIDQFSAMASCPGEPVDGQLGGELEAPESD